MSAADPWKRVRIAVFVLSLLSLTLGTVLAGGRPAPLVDEPTPVLLNTYLPLIIKQPSGPIPTGTRTPRPSATPTATDLPDITPQPSPTPTITQRALSMFGVEVVNPVLSEAASVARVSWARYNGVLWSQVEAVRGVRDWSVLANFEQAIVRINAAGMTPMVIVRGTPAWARQVANKECGPIKHDALNDFADFMHELVTYYSQPPYNVKYWELGNEPDAAHQLIGGNAPFGCWGNENDSYHGGAAYGEMLKRIYPAVKQADPAAQVVFGGLLLDCDPDRVYPSKSCGSGRFFEGALRAGAGSAFDLLAFHAYTYWWDETRNDWDAAHPFWNHRGGAFTGKIAFLREALARYGLSKPIILNETALLCYQSLSYCVKDQFYRDQANQLVRLFLRSWAQGLQGAIWYSLSIVGWQEGGLFDAQSQPRPSFRSLNFLAPLLEGSTYSGPLSSGTFEGYAFNGPAVEHRIYWSNDSSTMSLALPAGTQSVVDMFGDPVATSGGMVTLGFEPVIITIAP